MAFEVTEFVKNKKAFTITTDLVSVPTNTEYPILLLKNPTTAEQRIMITHFKFGTDSSNVRSLVRVYFNPTITADGTSVDIANTYVETNQKASDMQAFSQPTISDNGSVLNLDISPSDSPSKGLNRLYFVEPGNEILITIENSSPNAKTFADIYWIEGV